MSITEHEIQIQAARDALIAALREGEDTSPLREKIARLEAGLIEARRAESVTRRAEQAAKAVAIVEAGAVLAEREYSAIEAAVAADGLAELVGEVLPVAEHDPELAHAAEQVARAQAALDRAVAEHRPVQLQFQQLSERLQAKRQGITAICARRATGDEQPTDAADLALLQADIEGLELLVGDARIKADASGLTAAKSALERAQANLTYARNKAIFKAAKARVLQAEAVFIDAWRVMVEAGRSVGIGSPWAEFKASPEMTRAVTGQIVGGFRGQL